MNIEKILDEMENLVLRSARVLFTNKRVIEEDDLASLIDTLRETLPQEVAEARRIVAERNRILDEAQREASVIIDQAKSYVSKLTDESLIAKQAHEQAGEILDRAALQAKELKQDAVLYAEDVFNHLESNLEKVLMVVREGHSQLQQVRAENKD